MGPAWAVVSGGIGCVLAVLWIAWRTPELVRYERE
jgi:hypothetical protein